MSKIETLQLKTWALRESEKLEPVWPKGCPAEKRVLAAWANHSPKMMAELGPERAKALAHVLVDRTTPLRVWRILDHSTWPIILLRYIDNPPFSHPRT